MSEPAETPEAAPEDEQPSSAAAPAPERSKAKKRKKKKKRLKPGLEDAPARARLDAQGRERPAFVLDFPRDPELDEVIAAFEAGNYARVREQAPLLAERTGDPAVRDAALELRRRIEPDPLMKYLLLVAVMLLAFLSFWAYSHGR